MPPKEIVARKGASLSQALDNQYVPDRSLVELTGTNATSEKTRGGNALEVRRDFISSLLYSRQLIVNRAFFHNNATLYGMYDGSRPDEERAFAALLENATIVPYLHAGESELASDVSFATAGLGRNALNRLLDVVGTNYSVVRVDDEQAAKMGTRFEQYFLRLATVSDETVECIARGLSPVDGRTAKTRETLASALRYVGATANRLKTEGRLQRDTLYRALFGGGIDALQRGEGAIDPRIRDHFGPVKQLIDLCYNTALPQALKRYFSSPSGYPTGSALQEEAVFEVDQATASHGAGIELAHLRLRQRSEERRLTVLAPQKLSLDEVLAIREFPQWEAFIGAKDGLSTASAGQLDTAIENYFSTYVSFHEKLHHWVRNRRLDETYEEVIARAEQVLTYAGASFDLAIPLAGDILDTAVDSLQSAIRFAPDACQATMSVIVRTTDAITRRTAREASLLHQIGMVQSADMREDIRTIADLHATRTATYDGPAQSLTSPV